MGDDIRQMSEDLLEDIKNILQGGNDDKAPDAWDNLSQQGRQTVEKIIKNDSINVTSVSNVSRVREELELNQTDAVRVLKWCLKLRTDIEAIERTIEWDLDREKFNSFLSWFYYEKQFAIRNCRCIKRRKEFP